MRLHCSWAVLVAIVWTIQLRDSVAESIKHESTGRMIENISNDAEKSVSTYNNRDGNRRDNGERSKDESDPPLQTSDTKVIMENVAGKDIKVHNAKKIPLPEYTLNVVSTLASERKNDILETTDSNHYANNERGLLQPLLRNPCDLISLKEKTATPQGTNEGGNCAETSQASKAQKTVDMKMDEPAESENRSPHDKTEREKLSTVVGKSKTLMQQSEENLHGIMSSTTEYSGRKGELTIFSSSTIKNLTNIASVSIRNGLGLSSDDDSKLSSKDKSGSVVFLSRMEIGPENHGKEESKSKVSKGDGRKIAKTVQDAIIDRAQEKSIIDSTIINMGTPNLPDKMLDTNKLDESQAADTNTHDTLSPSKKQLYHRGLDLPGTTSSFVETTNFQRENTNRATISTPAKNNRGITLSLLPRRPTDFHTGLVSGKIASGLSQKRSGKNLELPAAHRLKGDASFSGNDPADGLGQSLTKISSQSNPYSKVSNERSENHQDEFKDNMKKLQNLRESNYPQPGKNKREFDFASVIMNESSERNGEKATITSGNKAEENEVSSSTRFGGRLDDVKRVKLTGKLGEMGGFRRKVQLDNTSNRNSEKEYRIFRSVVKNTLNDAQMKNRDHKILTSPATSRAIDFQQHQQLRQKMQAQKKTDREIDSLEKDGFLDLKNGATALENSSGFSLAAEMQHGNNVLDSISGVTPKRTRKIGLSASEPDDTQASWKIKTAPKHLIILRASEIVEPLGSQKFQRTNRREVESNARGDNLIKKEPLNFIGKIDVPVTGDSLLPTDSSFAVLHQRDFQPDDARGDKEYDCSHGNEKVKGFRAMCKHQRSKAFSYRAVSATNSQKESGHTSGGWRTTVDVDSDGFIPDGQRKRKRWKDKIVDATIATDTIVPGSNPSVSILLKDNDEITDVTRADSSDKKYVEKDRNDEAKGEFSRQSNYIRKMKIDETSDVLMVNRLTVRDSTVVNDDAPDIRRETRNDIAGETSAVEPCEACKIVAIVENPRTGPDTYRGDDRVVGGGRDGEESRKKLEQSISVLENSKDEIPGKITKKNEMPVVALFSRKDVGSLARPSAKFKLIDRLEPEARVYRRMHAENSEMLVRGQDPIFIKPEAENLILSREGVAHQPLSSGKLTLPDGAVTSGSMASILNEKVKNSSSLDQHAAPPDSFFPIKSEAREEPKHGPLISGLTDSFARTRISSHEFANNAAGIPRDYGNFNTYSTFQTRSLSGRRRKSVGHGQRTDSWTGSTKINSTASFPIYRSPYNDGSPMNESHLPHSHSEVSAPRHQDGRLSNNGSVEQIKRGFTSPESTSIPVTAPALTSSYGHASSITAAMPEDRDIKSTETIIRTTSDVVTGFELSRTYPAMTEIEKSSKTVETPPRGIANIAVVELSSEIPVGIGMSNPNQASISSSPSIVREKSMMVKPGESANLEQAQSKQTPENTVVGTGNILTLNYSVNDNSTRTTAMLNQWPVKYSAVVEGDLVLGGLMMVHEREDSVTCGPVMPQGGVQALEAMLYTLDWVNKRDLVPGVKIGAHILDDCDKDTYGLEMAVDFIKGSISNIDGAEYHCNKTAVRKVISGVVGAASSVTSIQVANLLRLFRIPQVSFFSTSPELSNKMRFEYFTRTIPSDHYQVKAMVDIVLVMGWSYVSIIYEESNYGEKAYEELEKLLGKHQICIAVKEKLSKDSGVAKAHVYDNIVLKLLTKPRARGCIIFASDQEVAGVMKAVRRCNATGAFSWIGSDGWSARSLVSDGNEPEMEGTLSVQPQANPVEGFEDYFLNLTVENNRRNPWFVEFWEDHFKCRYPNASQTPYNNYTEECTTTEKLTKQNTAFENQLQFVSDAVMAFAYAFRNMHIDLCHGIRGLCDAMKPTKGIELLNYLRTVQFKGLSGDVFHFDKNGDGPARYNIIHFKQVSPGKYKWIRVGKYLEGELRLNMSEIQFRLGHPQPPESVCSLPCEVGQAKKYVEGESCCWHCFNCTQYQIRHESDEKQCVLCPQGTVPDETHSYCRDIPENFLRPESGWAIGAMSFSSSGILITLFVGGVFLKHNDTPIVRASGRELSYVLLTGILLCYLVTFALVLRPNDLVCSIQRFSAGFCFTVVYAALLTKTNRISRIFNAGKRSAKRPSFISPRSQLIICSMLVAVQILINGVWMVIDPAKAMHHYPTREDNLLVCNSYIDASYMIAFTYPIILIVVCTVYAVLTRKIPEAFNESKHIGFTMYTTCVIWLAFVPLYFGTGSQVALRITSMSVTISLSASVTIACLFTPKLYIILIHPERNVRPNMMMTRYNTTKGSVVTATNASSMMAPVTLTAVTCDQNKAVKKHVITTMDCSTQSEQFEMETKDQKNGKLTPAVVTRSTQTLLNNNGKESEAVTTSPVIKDIIIEENLSVSKGLNKAKIGNGPLSQNDVPL